MSPEEVYRAQRIEEPNMSTFRMQENIIKSMEKRIAKLEELNNLLMVVRNDKYWQKIADVWKDIAIEERARGNFYSNASNEGSWCDVPEETRKQFLLGAAGQLL